MIRRARSQRSRALDLLWDRRSPRTGNGVLVAVENTGLEQGAMSVADLLARRDQITAHLVVISDSVNARHRLTPQERTDLTEGKLRRLQRSARQLLHNAVGRGGYWTVDAALGTVPRVLAEEAKKRRPKLVIVTLEDSSDERLRRVEKLIHVATATDGPVLAVPAHQQQLPTRVLVPTDFGRASKRAAQASLSLSGKGAQLTLLHVEPELDYDALGHPEWREANVEGVEKLFVQFRHELQESAAATEGQGSLTIDSRLLRGEPARAILDYAESDSSDLIVMGVPRVPHPIRPESVAMAILRDARSAILIAPASELWESWGRTMARPRARASRK